MLLADRHARAGCRCETISSRTFFFCCLSRDCRRNRNATMSKLQKQIERHEYLKPVTIVIEVGMNKILCASNEGVDEIPGLW